MTEKERKLERRRLDAEMRTYRVAGRKKNPTNDLLRAVRQTLGGSGGGDRGEDGGAPVGGVRPGDERAEKHDHAAVDVADGGGDGVQGGVWDCAERRENDGGAGGGTVVEGSAGKGRE